eukprot:1158696-Pelagomonas_calceolata.AAC.15
MAVMCLSCCEQDEAACTFPVMLGSKDQCVGGKGVVCSRRRQCCVQPKKACIQESGFTAAHEYAAGSLLPVWLQITAH